MSRHAITDMDLETRIERLKAEVTERWGDQWVVETFQFADGDYQCYATRSYGQNDDGYLVEDRLFISDTGETAVERVTMERREIDSETIEASTQASDMDSADRAHTAPRKNLTATVVVLSDDVPVTVVAESAVLLVVLSPVTRPEPITFEERA